MRIGEGDQLAGEARVGHRLLIAAHPGREDDLSGRHRGLRLGAARLAVEPRAVLEEDVGAHAPTTANARSLYATAPAATVSSLKRLGYIFDLNDLLGQPLLINERLLRFRPELEAAVEFPEDVVGQGSLLWKMIYDLASHYGAGDRRVHLVRHEDLSVNPQEQFAALYDRLHLPLTARAQRTIARFTSDRNPSEVPRANPVVAPLDSRRNVSNWMHRLQPEEIARIRRITQDVWPRYYTDDEWTPRAREHG